MIRPNGLKQINHLTILLKGQCHGDFDLFCQNYATMPLLDYKIILKHQEHVVIQFLKEEPIIHFGNKNVRTEKKFFNMRLIQASL